MSKGLHCVQQSPATVFALKLTCFRFKRCLGPTKTASVSGYSLYNRAVILQSIKLSVMMCFISWLSSCCNVCFLHDYAMSAYAPQQYFKNNFYKILQYIGKITMVFSIILGSINSLETDDMALITNMSFSIFR